MAEQQLPLPEGEPPSKAVASSGRRWWMGAGLLFVALVATGWLYKSGLLDRPDSAPAYVPPGPSEKQPAEFPLPPMSSSPFKNTTAEATYVGSESCRACHASRTASFRLTGMGRSMTVVDPAQEPPDAEFEHNKSKSRFQVKRKDGKLWHRELLQTTGSEEILLAEYPLAYAIGSGHYARTYAVEADGFLVESPVSWYTSRQAWDMSPGYDWPDRGGFDRAIAEGCLICHAGRAEPIGKTQHRMQILEAAIGCERCHGPGSLHLARHKDRPGAADEKAEGIDYTIVNPVHLDRERAEAVCQQCHLHSSATVLGRGLKIADFRPGLPLQDFRQDYWLESDRSAMTVVGHVEQMHLSRCYQGSKTLTCTTCHDPHGFPRPEERVGYYRTACLSCHKLESCKVSKDHLVRESPDNNCVKCHMPASPTDVPHVAFTHHRIGVHTVAVAGGGPTGLGTLRPFLENPRLSELDKKRSLGVAYLQLATGKDPQTAAQYKARAVTLMAAVHASGLRDPVLEAALGRQYFEQNQPQALLLAESALQFPGFAGAERCAALFVAAAERLKRKQFKEALATLLELVTLRRHGDDWMLVADCQLALNNPAARVEALQKVVRISPRSWQVHQFLADHFRQTGDLARAAWHQQRAVP